MPLFAQDDRLNIQYRTRNTEYRSVLILGLVIAKAAVNGVNTACGNLSGLFGSSILGDPGSSTPRCYVLSVMTEVIETGRLLHRNTPEVEF